MRRRWPFAIGLFVLASCADDRAESTVEIYSWWVTGAEQSALTAVLRDFTSYNPDISVHNAAAPDAVGAQAELANRIRANDPPDTFQMNGGIELLPYVNGIANGTGVSELKALDSLIPLDWQKFPVELMSQVQVNNSTYAVPVDLARVDVLFYNPAVFAQLSLTPPTTADEFARIAPTLEANNYAPLAIGDSSPWTLEVIFKWCLGTVPGGGAPYYGRFIRGENAYFSSPLETGETDPVFLEALACFGTMVQWAVPMTIRGQTWNGAVDLVEQRLAAMTIMGDWAIGEFAAQGGMQGIDFAEGRPSAVAEQFIYTTDTFVLPTQAKNRAGATALLSEWASERGQIKFSKSKGTLPARTDAAATIADPIADPIAYATLQAFNAAEMHKTAVPDWPLAIPAAFATAFDAALDRYVDDRNAENVVITVRNNYRMIVESHFPP